MEKGREEEGGGDAVKEKTACQNKIFDSCHMFFFIFPDITNNKQELLSGFYCCEQNKKGIEYV